MYRNIAGLILLAGVVAGFVVNRNFDYWFTWFHEKVFTNRLWMFDAKKDYMIRMLPEGFFFRYGNVVPVDFRCRCSYHRRIFMGEKQKRNNEKFRGNFPDG